MQSEEQRERTLTDKDIELVAKAMKQADHCVFDEETRSLLKLLSKVYGDSRSAALKGVVALLIMGGLLFIAFASGIIKPD